MYILSKILSHKWWLQRVERHAELDRGIMMEIEISTARSEKTAQVCEHC